MKKLLLILLCVPLMFSCGEKEKVSNNERSIDDITEDIYTIRGRKSIQDIPKEFSIRYNKLQSSFISPINYVKNDDNRKKSDSSYKRNSFF